MAESRPRRGHGEDSIYYDQANHYWVAAVSLGYKGGKRVRRKVTGRTKTEVRTKLRDLRRDLDSGIRPRATYTVSDTLPGALSYAGGDCSASGQVVTCTNTSGLAAGGTAMLLDLRAIAFPDTQFRASFAQTLSGSANGVTLCGQQGPLAPHARAAS